jgi:beta-lactamase regulating signal transducer with metallopeptidase domain
MGIVIYRAVSLYSFMISLFWVAIFVGLGLLLRKCKPVIRFSVKPLFFSLLLSVIRMLVVIELPGSTFIFSEVFYPAFLRFVRREIVSFQVLGIPINLINLFVIIWIVGAVLLLTRLVIELIRMHRIVMTFEPLPRCEKSEALLRDIKGYNHSVRVYRTSDVPCPMIFGCYRNILVPEIDIPTDELRVMLRHEWAHIRDRDPLIRLIVSVICSLFWWNPLIIIFARNIHFAQELKCDYFAVTNREDYDHFTHAYERLYHALLSAPDRFQLSRFSALISEDDAHDDRFELLGTREKVSRIKSMVLTVCSMAVVFALFIVSYWVSVFPRHWADSVAPTFADDFSIEYYRESGMIFSPEEVILIDNGDGSFSLYMNGQYIQSVAEYTGHLNLWPTRQRE